MVFKFKLIFILEFDPNPPNEVLWEDKSSSKGDFISVFNEYLAFNLKPEDFPNDDWNYSFSFIKKDLIDRV